MSAARDAMRIAGEFTAMGKRVPSDAEKVTRHYAMLAQTEARANSSGRPGPRAVTGAHRRGITVRMKVLKSAVEASVGPNSPQGRRLELGFVGVDSKGRHYNQPPYPYLFQVVDKFSRPYGDAVAALVHL